MAEQRETDTSIKDERRESVKKAFEDPGPSAAPDPSVFQPAPGTEKVGESTTRRGEDVAKEEREPGRYDTGTDGSPANRPTGESTPRDTSGVNPDGGT
jgi:hypothetical protein